MEQFVEDPLRPEWAVNVLTEGKLGYLSEAELKFWKDFIQKYVKPLKSSKKEEELKVKLIELRNNVNLALWFINAIWIILSCMIESVLPPLHLGPFITPPLGFVFLSLCFVSLVLQLFGMIIHRWETFLQLISSTVIPWGNKSYRIFEKEAVDEAIRMTKLIEQQRSLSINPQGTIKSTRRRSLGTQRIRSFFKHLQKQDASTTVKDFQKKPKETLSRADRYYNTISRGVALELERQLTGDELEQTCYLQPDELERRFERQLSLFMVENENEQ